MTPISGCKINLGCRWAWASQPSLPWSRAWGHPQPPECKWGGPELEATSDSRDSKVWGAGEGQWKVQKIMFRCLERRLLTSCKSLFDPILVQDGIRDNPTARVPGLWEEYSWGTERSMWLGFFAGARDLYCFGLPTSHGPGHHQWHSPRF